jgi:hypothetical protein
MELTENEKARAMADWEADLAAEARVRSEG